tara:strand:+ start:270 stop:971 length:702 start_codon:yes stop_codon:yes gene_type:complete
MYFGSSNFFKKINSNSRYELKFLLQSEFISFEKFLRSSRLGFKEIYSERIINNVYFDNNSLNSFNDNINGLPNRFKIRIRWYGDDWDIINEPKLELKIKNGHVGKKITFPINGFSNDILFDKKNRKNIFDNLSFSMKMKNQLKFLEPTLWNKYSRRYFLSRCGDFRLTYDFNLSFCSPYSIENKFFKKEPKLSLIELKFDNIFQMRKKINFDIPLRQSRFSKYVYGKSILINY